MVAATADAMFLLVPLHYCGEFAGYTGIVPLCCHLESVVYFEFLEVLKESYCLAANLMHMKASLFG